MLETEKDIKKGNQREAADETSQEMAESTDGNWLKALMAGQVKLPFNIRVSYLIFLVGLVFIYITNHLDVEKKLRTISDLKTEIKELRYEHTTTQSELMNMSKQSEVLRRIEADGLELKELTEPPRIISSN